MMVMMMVMMLLLMMLMTMTKKPQTDPAAVRQDWEMAMTMSIAIKIVKTFSDFSFMTLLSVLKQCRYTGLFVTNLNERS